MLLAPSGIGVDMTEHHLPAVNHIDQLVREDAMAINLRARWDYKKRKKKKAVFASVGRVLSIFVCLLSLQFWVPLV